MALSDAPGLRTEEDALVSVAAQQVAPPPIDEEMELPPVVYGETLDCDVVEALRRARRDMGVIQKTGRYAQGNTRYNFRGVDQVVNATAPILERHGLVIIPELVDYQGRDVDRQTGGRSHESIVKVRFWIFGPDGSKLEEPAVVVGEALNTSDKDAAAAQSVAWRIALCMILHIRTDDVDPDTQHIDRGSAPKFNANEYREEALKQNTSHARLLQMQNDVARLNVGQHLVINETGDEESIAHLLWRVKKERSSGSD